MTQAPVILRAGVAPVILRTEQTVRIVRKEESVIVRPINNIVVEETNEPVILRLESHVRIIEENKPLIFRAVVTASLNHNHDDRYYTEEEIDSALALKASLTDLSTAISDLIGGAPTDANTLKKLNDKILGVQTLLASDNVNLDNVQELVDAIETIQASLSTILVNDLTTGGITKALTAEQGKVLKGLIDSLTTVVASKVPTSRTITINGVSRDLSTDPTFTIPTASPGGNSTSIQTNKNGSLYGDDFNTYDDSTKIAHLYGSLGSEKVTNGGFTGNASGWTLGSGWAYSSNKVSHSSNGTATLSQTSVVSYGEYCCLVFTISNLTVGTVTVALGGVTLATISTNGTYTYKVRATSTGALTFTPSNTSRFDIDNISVKKFQGGEYNTGKGNFDDKVTVSVVGNNYYPGTVDTFELLNPTGAYTHQVYRFGATIKSVLSAFSDGTMRMGFTSTSGLTLGYGGTITGLSDYAQISYYGLRMFSPNAYGQFAGKVSAGYAYSNLPSKLDIWGSEMKLARLIDTQNFTLDDDCIYLFDTTNATGCTGTPSTGCSSYGSNQSLCESHAEIGCIFTIQYYCSDYHGSNYGNDMSPCANQSGCSVATSSCSSASNDMDCTNQNSPYGGSCGWNSYSEDCSPFDQSTCESNSGLGCSPSYSYCSKVYYDCAQWNSNETECNNHSGDGCSYDSGSGNCNGGNYQSCTGGTGCSEQSEGSCESYSFFTSCSGSTSYSICEGTYNNGGCNGGAQGTCGGTATCGNLVEGRCNNTYNPGCSWTNTLNIYLPNSTTFFTTYGSTKRGMTRDYKGYVLGAGTVTLRPSGNDVFEDLTTSKTLASGGKYGAIYFPIMGNCTDFNSNESTCGSTSGCTPTYDESLVFTGCSGEYTKYRKWFVTTLT